MNTEPYTPCNSGTWEPEETWPVPFTETQRARLAGGGAPGGTEDRVPVVASQLTTGSGWLIQPLPAAPDEVTCGDATEYEPDENGVVAFDIRFGTMPRSELDGLREFDGW
jgi:hypothetical protein